MDTSVKHPWAAAVALLIGFFMIMIDSTIVAVASPAILRYFRADIVSVQWVTSAYLLALAVPMLIAGRLGDRFGPKRVVVVGLIVFTAASVGCALAPSINVLVAARTVQGLGAALMSPQAMALITRIFPADRRGAPLGLWGATAGVAMLSGPVLGGVLVDQFDWRAIFFVNVPIGVIGLAATVALVPRLPRHRLRPDLIGALLSAAAIFCLVFGLQEGSRHNWGSMNDFVSSWWFLLIGFVLLGIFLVVEHWRRIDPLVPLAMFREHNFALATAAIAVVGFTMIAIPMPLQYFFQIARGMTPTQAALVLIPMALTSGVLAPIIGRRTAKVDPQRFALFGLILVVLTTLLYMILISPTSSVWWMLIPSAAAGIASACMWGPISLVATRDLPARRASTGSSIYNVMRQLGSAVGSAAITAVMESELTSDLPGNSQAASAIETGALSPQLSEGFAQAMSHSLTLPMLSALIGIVIVSFFRHRKATMDAFRPRDVSQTADLAVPRVGSG